MAYILALNPDILSASGMDKTAILIATCITSFIGTMAMAVFANYPLALSTGLGLNAYFAYVVCGEMGYSWQIALLAVFVEGVVFILLSLTNIREAIFNAIPANLKIAVSTGMGLFIAFIGLQKAGIVIHSDSTLISLTDFQSDFRTSGIFALLAFIGLFVIVFLYVKKIKGAILFGIIITWGLAILCERTKLYIPNPELGYHSVIPTDLLSFDLSPLSKTFGQCFHVDFNWRSIPDFIVVVCAFLFVDVFDTIGALIGVCTKAGLVNHEGKLPKIRSALLADAVATTCGAVLGTSTTTSFVESSAGVAEGGSTGLTAVATSVMFLISVFFFKMWSN